MRRTTSPIRDLFDKTRSRDTKAAIWLYIPNLALAADDDGAILVSVSTLTTSHEDSTLKVLTSDILLGVRWYDIPQYTSLQHFRELQSQFFARVAPRQAIVVSVSNAAGELHFDTGSRELVEAVMTDAKSHLLGMAQVITGGGFGAASVRSVLSGIQLAVRPDYPVRLFGDVVSAQPWIEELLVAAGRSDLARDVGPDLLALLEPPRAPIP
jgi:hypothetical protein